MYSLYVYKHMSLDNTNELNKYERKKNPPVYTQVRISLFHTLTHARKQAHTVSWSVFNGL